VSGGHVWAANYNGNSLTELNASNGSLVRVIHTVADRLNSPFGVTASGGRAWVTNYGGNLVTELKAPIGALVSVINAPTDGFSGPLASGGGSNAGLDEFDCR